MGNDELNQLYRDVILDHNKSPRHAARLEKPTRRAEGFNPVCGDRVVVELAVDDSGVIRDVCVDAHGCSISVSSGSIMSDELVGKSTEEARALVESFRDMMRGGALVATESGEVEALEGVKKFPVRIKCALLPWATLAQAIDTPCPLVGEKVVKTEEETW